MAFKQFLSHKIPLLTDEDEANNYIKLLQQNYLDFTKAYLSLKEYDSNLIGIYYDLNEKEYLIKSKEIHHVIDSILKYLKEINTLLIKLENTDVRDSRVKTKCNDSIKSINKAIRPKQEEISKIIQDISIKEKEKDVRIKGSTYDSDTSSNISTKIEINDVSVISEGVINDDLENREEELVHIQKVSNQVKEMAIFVNHCINDQTSKLGKC